MITYQIGKKYRSSVTDVIYACVGMFEGRPILRNPLAPELAAHSKAFILEERHDSIMKEVVEPLKPLKVRTVVARNVRMGNIVTASITDAYDPFGKFKLAVWPTPWCAPDFERLFDEITEVIQK